MTVLYSTLQLGLLYGLMALGIYISFRILNIPDLTAEGSFSFGLAVSAMTSTTGHPYLGLFFSLIAGTAAGCMTGLLQTKVKIHPILAGIITMSGLYSINLLVQGNAANVSLLGEETILSHVRGLLPAIDKDIVKILIPLVFSVLFLVVLWLFFKTHLGLCIRATGDNQDMLMASSVNVDLCKIIALGVSNGCIGFSGGLAAQLQGYADISSSVGMLVVGLASVIIGEAIFGRRSVTVGFISALVGSVIYRLIIALATRYQILPSYMLKLVSAVIVTVALALPSIKEAWKKAQIKKRGMQDAGNS